VGAIPAGLRSFFQLFRVTRRRGRKAQDIIQHSIAVGKYLVSPLIKDLDDGCFRLPYRSVPAAAAHTTASCASPLRQPCRRGAVDQAWAARDRTAPNAYAPLEQPRFLSNHDNHFQVIHAQGRMIDLHVP
jgi:hypothetical protein